MIVSFHPFQKTGKLNAVNFTLVARLLDGLRKCTTTQQTQVLQIGIRWESNPRPLDVKSVDLSIRVVVTRRRILLNRA